MSDPVWVFRRRFVSLGKNCVGSGNRSRRRDPSTLLAKNRPPQFGVGDAFRAAETAGEARVRFPSLMDPIDVGALVLKGVRSDELYLITHGEWKPMAEARHAALIAAMPEQLDQALTAMRKARPGAGNDN